MTGEDQQKLAREQRNAGAFAAAVQLAGIVAVALGIGWAVHPGWGLCAGGILIYVEMFRNTPAPPAAKG